MLVMLCDEILSSVIVQAVAEFSVCLSLIFADKGGEVMDSVAGCHLRCV